MFVATGLFFMLLPGTFLGVWNLLQVSARQSVSLVSPEWLQAHGHAQVFGWVTTFIMGIGLYAVPVVRAGARPSLTAVRVCWVLWTTGVALRWVANVYSWHWRILLPISAGLELVAFMVFLTSVSRHRPSDGTRRIDPWVRVVIAASTGLALTLATNLWLCIYLARRGFSPAVPHHLNERFLILATWGFLAPFVWGFSSKWLPVLLGLRSTWTPGLTLAIAANVAGLAFALAGHTAAGTVFFLCAAALAAGSLRLFEPAAQAAKTRGVHSSFPLFIRLAYVWLIVAAVLGIAAARWDVSGGIWGASRHAFTVGFVSVMVFSIGQRVLPAFAALGPVWSPRLMFAGLVLLTIGCVARVGAEIVAYQTGTAWAWSALPVSAWLELTAVTAFAVNMIATFVSAPEPWPAPSRSTSAGVPGLLMPEVQHEAKRTPR